MAFLEKLKRHLPVGEMLAHRQKVASGHQAIYLEYPVDPRQRYGEQNGAHPALARLFETSRANCLDLLDRLAGLGDKLAAIPRFRPQHERTPHWLNGWMQGLDAALLYAMPVLYGSRLYIEVGSGNSTRFVRRSVDDGTSNVRIVSIDPQPRVGIDSICDEVIRQPLEDVDLGTFDRLAANDILMIDNSHRCFQNSDVTVVFLDILPRLKPGVIVYIDDIYLPHDYPETWKDRYFSEQYLLATLLLADAGRRYEILMPGFFSGLDPVMREQVEAFWTRIGMPDMIPVVSNGFWMRVRD